MKTTTTQFTIKNRDILKAHRLLSSDRSIWGKVKQPYSDTYHVKGVLAAEGVGITLFDNGVNFTEQEV